MNTSILNPVVSIDKNLEEKLELLEHESLSFVVNWMVKNESYTKEKAIKSKNEFLIFMSLIHLSNNDLVVNIPIVPSHLADEFWHSFLLFNNKYNDWCLSNFGTIVNHFPGKATKEGWNKFNLATTKYYNIEFSSHGASSASTKDIGNGIDDIIEW